jgi:hypothetical protein
MSKQIYVRPAEAKDAELFTEWAKASAQINLFDPDVMSYPSTVTLVAHSDQPEVFMPLQTTVTLESLAPRPGISPLTEAVALRELIHAAALMAHMAKVKELYFLCKDDRVIELAKRHGFEELPFTTLRLKLDKIEKPHDQTSSSS